MTNILKMKKTYLKHLLEVKTALDDYFNEFHAMRKEYPEHVLPVETIKGFEKNVERYQNIADEFMVFENQLNDDTQKAVFRAYYADGMKPRLIAKMLEMSVREVRSSLKLAVLTISLKEVL